MPNLDIADEKLREIVKKLATNGLPPVFTDVSELTEEQKTEYLVLVKAQDTFNRTIGSGELPKPGSPWWNGCLAFRKALQKAIASGLLRSPTVQKHMFDFGAVPDPEFKWNWFYDFDGSARCWECGDKIIQKHIPVSHVNSRKGEFIGTIGGGKVPYCQTCGPEPGG